MAVTPHRSTLQAYLTDYSSLDYWVAYMAIYNFNYDESDEHRYLDATIGSLPWQVHRATRHGQSEWDNGTGEREYMCMTEVWL